MPPVADEMTPIERFREVLSHVTYKDWRFRVVQTGPHSFFMQAEFAAPDNDMIVGDVIRQGGRKWWLSEHMTDSEILQTALKAVLSAEEHEARETFKVDNCAVFGPHLDVFALVEMDKAGALPRSGRVPA